MSIRTSCSGCGQAFQAPEAMAGKSGKCPKCGAKLQVPTLAAAAAQQQSGSSSAADSGSTVELPDMASWTDDILGELPSNTPFDSSSTTASSPLSPSVSPLGPPPSSPSDRVSFAELLAPILGNHTFAIFTTLCLIGSVSFALYTAHPFVAAYMAITGLPLVVCLWIASRTRAEGGISAKRLAQMRSSVWDGVFEWNVITSLWSVFCLLGTSITVLYMIAGAYKLGDKVDYGEFFIALAIIILSAAISSIFWYIVGAIIFVICRCVLYNLETGKGFALTFVALYYFSSVIGSVFYCAMVHSAFDYAHPIASSGFNRFSGSSPFGKDRGRDPSSDSVDPSVPNSHGSSSNTQAERDKIRQSRVGSSSSTFLNGNKRTTTSSATPSGTSSGTSSAENNLPGLSKVRPGILATKVRLPVKPGEPGSGMELYIYMPEGTLAPHSTPCVFIAPAGSNGLHGMRLEEGDRAEHYPYVNAGMIVVAYEVDGALTSDDPTTAQAAQAYRKYKDAEGGIANARLAKDYAIKNIPAINSQHLIAAGHSSAANLALSFAAKDPRISRIVALSPVIDMYDQTKDALVELPRISSEFRDVRSFVRSMSPDYSMLMLHRPLFLFQAKDDEIANFSVTSAAFEKLRNLGRDVTLETVATGGHHDAMVRDGLPAAVRWLQKGLDEASQNAPTTDRKLGQGTRTPPTRDSSTNSTSKSNQPRSRRDYGAADYNARKLPRIKSAQDDARLTRIDYLLGSDESAKSRMRWSPGRNCPDVLTLWCVGLSVAGGPGQDEIKRARDFRDVTGPIGESIVSGIVSRSKLSQFGEWPLFSHSFYSDPMLLSISEKNLADFARKAGADCLVHLSVEVSFVGLNRVRRSTIVSKLIDLHGDIPEWESEKLSSRNADEGSTSEFSETVLLKIDENYLLEPVNESLVNRDWVMQRIRDLLKQRSSDALDTPPLAFLCELRYYLARDLMTKEEGEKTCDLFFGPGSWKNLFEGDWERRMLALQLAKFVPAPKSPPADP